MLLKTVKTIITKPVSKVKRNFKKERNYTKVGKIAYYRRRYNYLLSQKYLSIAQEYNDSEYQAMAYRVLYCSNSIQYEQYTNSKQRIINMVSCKDRLCPTCNYRRSQRIFAKLVRIIKSKEFLDKKYKLIFLTLTLKNISQSRLGQGIDDILYSFNKFTKNKRIKAMNKGFFRALEITFNRDSRDYHHHLHVVFAVNSSYFTDSKQYLKQKDFTDIWRSSAGLDYSPVVYVERVKDAGGIAELAKYSVKVDKELIEDLTNLEFKTLRDELTRRRLVSLGGILRQLDAKLKLNLSKGGDITSDDIDDEYYKDEILRFIAGLSWNVGLGKYKLVEKQDVAL